MTVGPDDRILLLMSRGRDSAIAANLLREAGHEALACADLDALCTEVEVGASVVAATEEALFDVDLRRLAAWIEQQPPWSDLPFVLLTRRTGGLEQNPAALRLMRALGNVTFLERPFHPTTLVSLIDSALRARRRQYETRDLLRERERGAAALRESAEKLAFALSAGKMGAWELDMQTQTLETSDVCKRLFGRAPGDSFTYDDLLAAVHPDDQERMHAAVAQALAGTSDYDIEYRNVWPDGSVHWVNVRGRVKDIRGSRRMAGVSLDVTHRKRAEEQQWLLTAELDHRVKNVLAVIQSLVAHTMQGASGLNDFSEVLRGRIQAVARTNSLLSQARWEGIALHTLLNEELQPFTGADDQRVRLAGPDLLLRPKAATALGMAIHELATNAAKYGALSRPEGRIDLAWRLVAPGPARSLELQWRERGGPPVAEPLRRGFGSTLIERSLAYEVDGSAVMSFPSDGLVCDIAIPEEQLLHMHESSPQPIEPEPVSADAGLAVRSHRILVVEDSALVAMEVDAAVQDLGWETIGPVSRLPQALEMAAAESLDGAVLDINLDGVSVYPVADKLLERGIPFVFATGYDRDAVLPPRFRRARTIQKPFTPEAMRETLSHLLDGGAPDAVPARAGL